MIGGRRILAGKDGIADVLAAARKAGAIRFCPFRQANSRNRLLRVEPPAMRDIRPPVGIVGQASANSRIAASGIAMWRRQRLGDIGARTEAGIDEARLLQPVKSVGIKLRSSRLDDRLTVMSDAQPGEVLENPIDELRPASARIEILDSQ